MTIITIAVAALAVVVGLRALANARSRRLRERGTFAGLLEELAAVETTSMAPWRSMSGKRERPASTDWPALALAA